MHNPLPLTSQIIHQRTRPSEQEMLSAAMTCRRRNRNGDRPRVHGGLHDEHMPAAEMNIMVTPNVQTDPDIANGVRGGIVDIILHSEGPSIPSHEQAVALRDPPAYVPVRLNRTRVRQFRARKNQSFSFSLLPRRTMTIPSTKKRPSASSCP